MGCDVHFQSQHTFKCKHTIQLPVAEKLHTQKVHTQCFTYLTKMHVGYMESLHNLDSIQQFGETIGPKLLLVKVFDHAIFFVTLAITIVHAAY